MADKEAPRKPQVRGRFGVGFLAELRALSLFFEQAVADRAGFEPAELSLDGFQDRFLRPLGHLSSVHEEAHTSIPYAQVSIIAERKPLKAGRHAQSDTGLYT